MTYAEFLSAKSQRGRSSGLSSPEIPEFLYGFQRDLVLWALDRGRCAIFADCGLGKTPMELVWAQNVVRHSNKPVLVVTPLAVSYQAIREAEKFGIEAARSTDGFVPHKPTVVVTNYERLHYFDASLFGGVVCDESSILKNFDGTRRAIVTEFLRTVPYRLLCTATAAPNDYIELGTSSEALGEMGYVDMLGRFFVNDQNATKPNRLWDGAKWRFKGHAELPFWRWVCSWSRACRRPSDLGHDDGPFVLPPLTEREHIISATKARDGLLFDLPAVGLADQREERRRTIRERCELAAELATRKDQSLVWCHLNKEGDLLTDLIPGAEQVRGSDSDDAKEERLRAFAEGELRCLVTKPRIGAWGLNLQGCAHVTYFPSHSYEQYYQGIRRCWRFGQTREVRVDIVATEGDRMVLRNLQRKAKAADAMFEALVREMNAAQNVTTRNDYNERTEVPSWL